MSHRGDGRGDGRVVNVHSQARREHQQESPPLPCRSVAASLKYPAGACVPDYARVEGNPIYWTWFFMKVWLPVVFGQFLVGPIQHQIYITYCAAWLYDPWFWTLKIDNMYGPTTVYMRVKAKCSRYWFGPTHQRQLYLALTCLFGQPIYVVWIIIPGRTVE